MNDRQLVSTLEVRVLIFSCKWFCGVLKYVCTKGKRRSWRGWKEV